MNEDISGLKDDIAFMRALAEEGRAPPVLGGVILATAGTVFGLASIGQWAMLSGIIPTSGSSEAAIWAAPMIIFFGVLIAFKARMRSSPGASSPAGRAVNMVWTAGAGWGIFTLFLSIALVSWRANSPVPQMLVPPIILTLYGVCWSVAAAVTRRRWTWMTAIGAYAGALVTAFVCNQPVVYLIYAAALIGLVGLPGLVLMRQDPRTAV